MEIQDCTPSFHMYIFAAVITVKLSPVTLTTRFLSAKSIRYNFRILLDIFQELRQPPVALLKLRLWNKVKWNMTRQECTTGVQAGTSANALWIDKKRQWQFCRQVVLLIVLCALLKSFLASTFKMEWLCCNREDIAHKGGFRTLWTLPPTKVVFSISLSALNGMAEGRLLNPFCKKIRCKCSDTRIFSI